MGIRVPRTRSLLVITAVVAISAGVGGLTLFNNSDGPAVAIAATSATAPVERTDLVSRTDVDGTLGSTENYTITGESTGRVTWLPEVGDDLKRGAKVYEVDGNGVRLFYGSTPLWRPLYSGVSHGKDVLMLEQNLKALGYGEDLTVDKDYTSATASAVEKWQDDAGLDQTGQIDPGDVVIEPGEIRISSAKTALGSAARGPILTATDTDKSVTVNLPVSQQYLAVPKAKVRVLLPGGKSVDGKIYKLGTTASAGSTGSGSKAQTGQGTETATIPVYISLDKPSAAGRLDGAPVTVGFTSTSRKKVLAVPVNALLASPDGSYAVEAYENARHWTIPVKLGIFSDGKVEITGNGLREGLRVGVPQS